MDKLLEHILESLKCNRWYWLVWVGVAIPFLIRWFSTFPKNETEIKIAPKPKIKLNSTPPEARSGSKTGPHPSPVSKKAASTQTLALLETEPSSPEPRCPQSLEIYPAIWDLHWLRGSANEIVLNGQPFDFQGYLPKPGISKRISDAQGIVNVTFGLPDEPDDIIEQRRAAMTTWLDGEFGNRILLLHLNLGLRRKSTEKEPNLILLSLRCAEPLESIPLEVMKTALVAFLNLPANGSPVTTADFSEAELITKKRVSEISI